MKLLINASNLYVGGGVQVAVSYIEEAVRINRPFCAAVSPVVYSQLSDIAKSSCVQIDKSPSGMLNFGTRRKLDEIVSTCEITTVFTIFGPSYWSPRKVHHIVGFALPWLIYDTQSVFKKLTWKNKLKTILLSFLQPFFYRKNANAIITETEDVSLRVKKLLKKPDIDVYTVSNTLNDIFKDDKQYDYSAIDKLPVKSAEDFWLLTISHNHPHKNLDTIKELVKRLPPNYKFVTTLDESFADELSSEHRERIIRLGAVTLFQCPPLYQTCDALFLPTLLECFSASYLEAMYTNKIILTSDLSFARAVCKDSAIYFDPYDINDIIDKILIVGEDSALRTEKTLSGKQVLSSFPDARQRAIKYFEILSKA
ncbi:glycosyltransferase family 4 protein [Enterobacteriaceae bacterium 4M9]|nr:glycosyltransferase family 4 protein [Enterobacteriaceae bacterium 4M9]